MAVTLDNPFSSRTSRLVLGSAVAMCLVAAVAAAPSASTGFAAKSPVKAAITLNNDAIRPLAPGAGIRVGRAFDGEDEDCTLVRLLSDADCHIAIGTNPTATTSGVKIKAGVPETFAIRAGSATVTVTASDATGRQGSSSTTTTPPTTC